MAKSPALLTNYGVDYVIVYKYDLKGKPLKPTHYLETQA